MLSKRMRLPAALIASGMSVAAYCIMNGIWEGNSQAQLLTIGLIIIGIISMTSDEGPEAVTIEEVEKAAYRYVRRKQVEADAPSGSISLRMEARKVRTDGVPVYWEQGVKIENTQAGNPTYPIRVELYKDSKGRVQVSGVTRHSDWTASESPDVVILEPPDMITYARLKRMEEEKGKHE